MGMIAGFSRFDQRARERQRLGSQGAASKCRRIDPKSGEVIGEIRPHVITVPQGKLWMHCWRPKVIVVGRADPKAAR